MRKTSEIRPELGCDLEKYALKRRTPYITNKALNSSHFMNTFWWFFPALRVNCNAKPAATVVAVTEIVKHKR